MTGTEHEESFALADALRPALLRVSRRLRGAAQRAGLSTIDAQLLMVVRKSPGIGAADLADREQITRASMSGHVKRLEEAGLIVKDQPRASDRRRIGLRLSPLGEAAVEAIRIGRNDWLAERLSRLTAAQRHALAAAVAPLEALVGGLK